MIPSNTVTIRAATVVTEGVTTIIAILTYLGPPQRQFHFGIQAGMDPTAGRVASIERRAIAQVVDQFILWAQNGKPA